jgi:ABC-type bacteriocin/lantibiotic exporter with double-glycine peptidase domain
MAGVGCTLCCLSMALSANGYVIDPLILNREIKKNKGYTKTGLLIWNSVYRITKNKYKVAVPAFPSHSEIDDQLKNKNPVIIKIFLNNVIYHWVLIVGKEENEYLVFDPLNHKKTARLLSEYESKIYSMRYVRKN